MKKRIVYIFLFIMFLILSFSTTVNAQSIDADDVQSRTYIIGEHMYTRDANEEYTGSLTTQYIMYGASTINSNDVDEFIIYYKTPLGEWKNALTNQTVTAPETFDIKYTNGEQSVDIKYGDIDCNGKIDTADVIYISRYLAGYEMPKEVDMANGDINGDVKITDADEVLLRKYIVGNYSDAKLPDKPLGKSYIIEYVVDDETYEIDYELEGQTLSNNQKPSDPEKVGYIFDGWYTNVDYKTRFAFDSMKITEDTKLYAKFVKLQYGDVNCDGKIDVADVIYIRRYLAGYEMPEQVDMINGDVNGDGKVAESDVVLLRKYLVGNYPDAKLPEEPLGKTYIIEYVIDNISDFETYAIDYELEGEPLYKNQRPDDPEKEGHVFDGWYTDVDCTTKFEFDSMKITEDIILYAKFVKPQYGDVNCDGEIDVADLIYIRRYLAGYEMPEQVNMINGDVNGDGKVAESDVVLLRKYLVKNYPDANLPEEPLGKTYIIEYVIDNISDFETYAVDYELEGEPLYKNQRPDDPEKEGYIFKGWYTDAEYTTKFGFDSTPITENIILYAKFVELQYGDVDCNGKVDIGDVTNISRYVDGFEMPEGVDITNGDVNDDRKVTEADVVLLQKYLAGNYPDANLPAKSLGKSYIVEYVIDNISTIDTYEIDYELEGHSISKNNKPSDPEKEGYIFDGWYIDIEGTIKFEFGITEITEDTILCAKFVEAQ